MTQDIIISTFNARYTHSSLGLRYLLANLKDLREHASIEEFVINSSVAEAAEKILSHKPKIVGLGAYIWNAKEVAQTLNIIKSIAPNVLVVLGGPEASYLPRRVDFSQADFIIQGEGELAFYDLCKSILDKKIPKERFIKAQVIDPKSIFMPYYEYTQNDINHRYIYVEASRGCPFTCEFCLSSLDKKVRYFDTEKFLCELEILWNKGVRNFKFIDRTFNLNIKIANALMDFFLSKEPSYFIHFEVIPDHFPESLKERIKQFPPASLQLEIGIQTLHDDIAQNINRKLDFRKIEKNLRFLESTQAHLHVDLIVGLPGESVEQFGKNLDKLIKMTSCEIQIGILKKLSGTTLDRHDKKWGMVYSEEPPYDILQNDLIPFEQMQEMKRFARFWDMVYNSGNFKKSVQHLFATGSAFEGFYTFSKWLYAQTESTWQISLDRLAKLLYDYIVELLHVEQNVIKEQMIQDIMSVEGRKLPKFLRSYKDENKKRQNAPLTFNKRQQRHIV